ARFRYRDTHGAPVRRLRQCASSRAPESPAYRSPRRRPLAAAPATVAGSVDIRRALREPLPAFQRGSPAMRTALLPPNANELDMNVSTRTSPRGSLGT